MREGEGATGENKDTDVLGREREMVAARLGMNTGVGLEVGETSGGEGAGESGGKRAIASSLWLNDSETPRDGFYFVS